ncbi:hypothetical protein QUU53_22470, partial [Xanthomonas citri pv. citri]
MQDRIIALLIQVMVKEKLIISTRALLDFVYNLLVPSVMENMSHNQIIEYVQEQDFKDYVACLLPFQIFEKVDASAIHRAIDQINPTRIRTEQMDRYLIEFKSLKEGAGLFANHINVSRLPYLSKSIFQNSPWRNSDGKE